MQDKNYLMVNLYYYKYELDEKGKYVGTRYQEDEEVSYLFFDNKNILKFIMTASNRQELNKIYYKLHRGSVHLSEKQWTGADIKTKGTGRCVVMTGHIRGLMEDKKLNELNKSIASLQFGTKMTRNGF